MTRQSLMQQIRGNALSINQIVADLSTSNEPLVENFIEVQREKFRMLTGASKGRSKNSFPTGKISRLKKADLQKILKQQQKFLKSKVISEEGRSEIFKKQYETFVKNRPGVNITENTLLQVQRFLASNLRIYAELTEDKKYGSDQIVELVLAGYDAVEIIRAFQRIDAADVKNSIRRGKWKSFIKAVLREPERSVEEIAENYRRRP